MAYTSSPSFSVVRIRYPHANFGHPVSLQQNLASQFLPLLKQFYRTGCRAGDVETHILESIADTLDFFFINAVEILNQLYIDSGHRHKYIIGASCHFLCNLWNIKLGKKMDSCSCPQTTTQNINNSVNMVEGEKKRNDIVTAPFPGINECSDLRDDGFVSADHAFRFVGSAAGKQHHCAAVFLKHWQVAGSLRQHIVH